MEISLRLGPLRSQRMQNRGIGTALLDDAFEYLKSIGADKVGLLVNYGNENAKTLFEKLGFKLWSHFLVKRF